VLLIECGPHPEPLHHFPVILAAPNTPHKLALIVKMKAYNDVVISEYDFTCKNDIDIDELMESLK
jgi:hypothetical protein